MKNQSIDNIKSQKQLLESLAHCKNKIRKAIIKNADKKLIQAICDCVFNLLNGNIELNSKEKENLAKYKNSLRRLVENSTIESKKKIIIQQGGFLQYLIPAAISGIASIISSFIAKPDSVDS